MNEWLKTNWLYLVGGAVVLFFGFQLVSGNVSGRKAEKQLADAIEKQRSDIAELTGILGEYQRLDEQFNQLGIAISDIDGQFKLVQSGLEQLRGDIEQYRAEVERTVGLTEGNATLIGDSLELLDIIEKAMDTKAVDNGDS